MIRFVVFFVGVFLLLLATTSQYDGVSAVDVRILATLWLTDFGADVPYDIVATQSEAAAIMLAVRHFNERRADLIPALASVANCAKNLTIVSICDESANSRRITSVLREFDAEYDIVVGMSSLATGSAATFADVDQGVPLISNWATEPALSDKTNFPLFSRTFISDTSYFAKLAVFIKQLNIAKVSILFMGSDITPIKKDILSELLYQQGIDVIAIPYIYDDAESIQDAMNRVKGTDRNVIIYIGWLTDLEAHVPAAAAAAGLNSTDHLWIWTTTDTAPAPSSVAEDKLFSDFLRGSLYFGYSNPTTTLLENFLATFTSELASNPNIVPQFNLKLPPFGSMNEISGSCKNDALNFSLSSDYFAEASTEIADFNIGAITGYDAVIAVGLGVCTDQSATMPADGMEFSDWIRAVSFQGLSGYIEFDANGDRKDGDIEFTLYNWRTIQNGAVDLVRIGQFNGSYWIFNESSIEFRGGLGLASKPTDFTRPVQTLNYLPEALRIIGYIEVAVGSLLILACVLWMFRERTSTVVRATQPAFMLLLALGCLVSLAAILPLTADDDPTNPIQSKGSLACMAVPYMYFIGFQTILWAIIGKSLRAYSIFESRSLYHHRMREYHVTLLVAAMLGLNLVLLINWEYISPFVYQRFVMQIDRHGQTIESRGECTFQVDTRGYGFFAGLFVMYALSMIILRVVASFSVRFVEEQHLSVALLQVTILVVPAVIAAFNNGIGRFVILSTYFLVSVIIVLVFMFYPPYATLKEIRSRDAIALIREGKKEGSQIEVDVLDGLRIPMVQIKFRKFAEENYVIESYLFLIDCLAYKDEYAERSLSWRQDKISCIVKVYIVAGSFLQVNISDRLREKIIAQFKAVQTGTQQPDEDMFDEPMKEVSAMLNYGAWSAFVQDGGMFNIRNSLIPVKSKVAFGGWRGNTTSTDPEASAKKVKSHASSENFMAFNQVGSKQVTNESA